jgi:hypothetical protein
MSHRRWEVMPFEMREQIRAAVANGESRYKVAKRFGIRPSSVYPFTKDLPGINPKFGNRLSKKEKRDVRKLFKIRLARTQVASLTNRTVTTVRRHTIDLPGSKGDRVLGTMSMHIINKILQDGYYIPESKYMGFLTYCRSIMKNFPVRHVHYSYGCDILFLEDRKEEAFLGFVRRFGSIVSGKKIKQVEGLFGISDGYKVRKNLVGLLREMQNQKKRAKTFAKGAKASLKEGSSDFIGHFSHSEVLSERRGRNQRFCAIL